MTKLSAKLNASNKKLTTEDQKKTYTVDDSWLADEKSYKGNNLATGGLYLRESSNNRFFDTANRGKRKMVQLQPSRCCMDSTMIWYYLQIGRRI